MARLHPAHRVADQRRDVAQAELLLDVAAVDVDGLRAEVQRGGDVAGAFALADELEERQALKAKLGKGGMKKAKMEARAKCNKLPTQPERLKCKQDYIRGVASGRS